MRPYRSVTGPLVLILVGVVFLLQTLSPGLRWFDLFVQYWPWLLIGWGVIGLIEVCIQFSLNHSLPANGVSGGGWLLVVLICALGFSAFEWHRPDTWWRQAGFDRSMQAFGQEHEFSVEPIQRTAGRAPHVVIENFRGDAKITGIAGELVTVAGHKTIQSMNNHDAERANTQTPVEIVSKGDRIVIRCHQDRAESRTTVTTNLDISVPKGASLEATGSKGDFDVSSLTGDVDISSENAGIRLQDLGGGAKLDTRRSDLIRCTNMRGTVDLRGHGTDVELTKIAGQVTMSGSYGGSVSFHELAKSVKVENLRTDFSVQQVPGEIRLERGSLSMNNVVGPIHLTTRTTDVTLDNFTEGLDLSADKGDIELRPGRLPLGRMNVHTGSGNIELTLPQRAGFAMKASTESGEIENDFGSGLQQRADGRGAKLEGSVGDGPDVSLVTNRGRISVRKMTGEVVNGRMALLPPVPPIPAMADKW